MKIRNSLILLASLLVLGASARADTLELKNGTVLQGKYLGGTAETVRFETSAGMQIIEYAQIKNMSVSPAAAAAPAAPAAAPAPTTVTVPAGTVFMVTMMEGVSSKSAPGTNFTTKLAYDLVANGQVVVKAGAVVYGKVQSSSQAGRLRGMSTLDIRLTQILLNGSPVPIVTSGYAQKGQNESKQTLAAAGAGAIIGNNTGNGDAGKGAAYGVAAAALRPGQTLTVPPGALVEFSLTQPATVPVSR